MPRRAFGPPRKPVKIIRGIGTLPAAASRVAAIRPKVVPGSSTMASGTPSSGSWLIRVMPAMNMKNRPVRASGWRKKVRTPSLTQTKPVRAGTSWSFMPFQPW